jgi:hypothetical protein
MYSADGTLITDMVVVTPQSLVDCTGDSQQQVLQADPEVKSDYTLICSSIPLRGRSVFE